MATPAVEMKEISPQQKKWRRYPRYKDSGVEWLGEVPEQWDIGRLKFVIRSMVGGGTPESGNVDYYSETDNGIPWVTIADISKHAIIKDTINKITEQGLKSKNLILLPKGTILYTIYASLGKVSILGIPATTNQAIIGIINDDNLIYQNFLINWLNAIQKEIIQFASSNTQNNLNAEKIRNMPIYIPPLPEQHAIAAFLDRETARIDALIAKKEWQIELLQEKRAALISHTVTKGLDPNAKMKDSGVEWLGEVPEHWEIKRIKYVSPRINEKTEEETDLPYIGLENIESWTGKLIPNEENYEAEGQSNKFQKGDVLFNKLRPYLAKVLVATEIGRCTSELLVLRPKMVTQYYLFYFLLSKDFVNTVDSSTYGAKMPRANWNFIGDLLSPLPPAHEQEAIATFLNIEAAKIDGLINKINNSIGKVNEYRAALISAAVTGKIDVRQEILA